MASMDQTQVRLRIEGLKSELEIAMVAEDAPRAIAILRQLFDELAPDLPPEDVAELGALMRQLEAFGRFVERLRQYEPSAAGVVDA